MQYQIQCPETCRGCLAFKESYENVTTTKENRAHQVLAPYQKLIRKIIVPEEKSRTGYRTKAILHTRFDESYWKFGLMRHDEVIDIPECFIQTAIINESATIVKGHLQNFPGLPLVYYVQSGRHIVFVLKTRESDFKEVFSDELFQQLSAIGVEGIWLHFNPSAGRKVFLKDRLTLLWGKTESAGSDGLFYGPMSFRQQIVSVSANSLDMALEFFIAENDSRICVDLYSGIGAGLKKFNKAGFHCMGVELSDEAIRMAALNSPGSHILKGKCHQRIPQIEAFLSNHNAQNGAWNLYVNPPRSGLDMELTDWIIKQNPKTLAYLSCSPFTLSRDLDVLCKKNYRAVNIQPFDFFPYTRHIEVLVLLKRI